MKKTSVLFLFIIIFLFTGCVAENTNKDASDNGNNDYFENHYIFKGESENWTGEMKVDSTLEFYEKDGILGCNANEDSVLTVTYKGDVSELSSVKHLKISYDAHSHAGSLEEEHSDEDPLRQKTFTFKSNGGGAQIQEFFVVTVTVTIDGKTESFEMRNQG